jgi:hypothetical protein
MIHIKKLMKSAINDKNATRYQRPNITIIRPHS